MAASKEYTVYRYYDKRNRLLYVGISNDWIRRCRQHRRQKEWWPEVSRISLGFYATKHTARIVESKIIHRQIPRYNEAGRKIPKWLVKLIHFLRH